MSLAAAVGTKKGRVFVDQLCQCSALTSARHEFLRNRLIQRNGSVIWEEH